MQVRKATHTPELHLPVNWMTSVQQPGSVVREMLHAVCLTLNVLLSFEADMPQCYIFILEMFGSRVYVFYFYY